MNERNRQKARYWHRLEFGLVALLAVVAAIGWVWSEAHNGQLIETHPR